MTQSPRDSRRRSGERAAVIAMFFTPALARASARESFLTDASTTGAPVPRTKQGTWSSITTGPSADAARRDASKRWPPAPPSQKKRSEEHTSELQSRLHLVCRLLLEKND